MVRPARHLVVLIGIALGMALLGWTSQAGAQQDPLRYQWKAGQQFAYDIEINVELPDKQVSYKGLTRYTVDAVNGEELRVTYRGGLNESSKPKPTDASRGIPFGPGALRPPSFPDPFARPAFAGKVQSTNRITMSSRGGVLAMEGDSQLPYLLGNVSLLPFETLPDGAQREWTVDSGVSISQKAEHRRPFGPFGPFGGKTPQAVKAAREVTSYTIQSDDASRTIVKKSYTLKSPKAGDQPAFDLSGNGTWTFHRTEGVPESLDFQQKLVINQENTQLTIPITVAYTRLTPEAIAKLDGEAERRKEEREQAEAEKRRQAEAPLNEQEKQDVLAALTSGDTETVLNGLAKLQGKTPKDPHPEVAEAIQSLLNDENKRVQELAHKTLVNWSPDYKRKVSLNNAYNGHMPVSSTDRMVSDSTPLYVGQLVQAQLHGSFWYAVEILDLLPDGKVMVRKRGFAPRDHTVARRNLQLAPDEVEQPNQPASSLASIVAAARTWTDSTGM